MPADRAVLGDGYLVRHDSTAGERNLVDFHSGTAAAPQPFADLPASPIADDRGISWTVDRHSGDVAYVGADRSVHVFAPGVPASSLTAHAYPNASWVALRAGTAGVSETIPRMSITAGARGCRPGGGGRRSPPGRGLVDRAW